jgi:Bifunctional DNA primase/polymerase, N-terminal
MPEVFARWQAEYAARGVPTFPVDPVAKRPAITNYNVVGLKGSRQLALKFPDSNGLACMAGARNRLTIIDIDARGAEADRLAAEAQRLHGRSRLIVRTGRDGRHLYYQHSGEHRKIRPDPSQPIDIIGTGMLVLPPSLGAMQPYEIIEGNLDDLTALTKINRAPTPTPTTPTPEPTPSKELLRHVQHGERDKNFWPYVARMAHQAQSLNHLIADATELSNMMQMPFGPRDITDKCKFWWDKTRNGKNRFGSGGGFVIADHAVIDKLMMTDPDGFTLLMFVRRHHWRRDFALANETCALMPRDGWDRKRFAAARSRLIEAGYLIVVRAATPSRPMLCRISP